MKGNIDQEAAEKGRPPWGLEKELNGQKTSMNGGG